MNNTHFIITGAGSGIGQALAVLAASKGAKIIATDINQKGLEETRDKVVAQNGWINCTYSMWLMLRQLLLLPKW
jgi:NAD(P)-dependent dehydrogenase (short-subunit alcohol dehydrogenase family)